MPGRFSPGCYREAKIHQFHLSINHQDIAWFQVTLKDATPVQINECLQRLDDQYKILMAFLSLSCFKDGLCVGQIFHREERYTIFIKAVIQNADNVWMAQRG